jgi:ribonuclease PH
VNRASQHALTHLETFRFSSNREWPLSFVLSRFLSENRFPLFRKRSKARRNTASCFDLASGLINLGFLSRMRPSKRKPDEMRRVSIERGFALHAEGSCLIKFGNTHVLCTASLEERVPPWLKQQGGRGWVTAEYAMLPRATGSRTRREVTQGHPSGRTQEIQRLIGRALRTVVDLKALGERQITVDCDVIQADGGTRTASITGAWVALHDCIEWMRARDMIKGNVLKDQVAAVSCGIHNGQCVLDLDYAEDSEADADANFVITGSGGLIEVQATAEKTPMTQAQLDELMSFARKGIKELVSLQKLTVA